MDSSPAVRDAAVELIGKYMIDSPALAGDYYDQISERIAVSESVQWRTFIDFVFRTRASECERESSS